MILDIDQEIISQRRNKLRILLNKPNHTKNLCQQQHQIIKSVLEPPKRIFSYSRSIRHFQEIMSKTGSVSVNQKAITLYFKQREANNQKLQSDQIKPTNSKFIQTDDLITEEQNSKTDRTLWNMQESPYIRKRKFANHSYQKEKYPKQLQLHKETQEYHLSNSPNTGRNIKQYTFQNEILKQKFDSIIPFYDRSTHFFNKKRLHQIHHDKCEKLDTIFTTITHRY
ncbi:unnamed protein product [Paramecium pentaurelia]|uniref:Uncharacterized protein n=1 Tax=Paramecium pentaurelia TaxID=43138 RepID=A0A8S1YF81_9CILI|nr:unnamed protein product [Paramecium pentaurelia]